MNVVSVLVSSLKFMQIMLCYEKWFDEDIHNLLKGWLYACDWHELIKPKCLRLLFARQLFNGVTEMS